jgi:integrase
MLYETAARSAEVFALDVEDLDLLNRRAQVRRKGGSVDVIVWQTGTARLLRRLLKDRKSGPLFVTERKARVQMPAADLDEYGRADRPRVSAAPGPGIRPVPHHRPQLRAHLRRCPRDWAAGADEEKRDAFLVSCWR